MVQGGEVMRSYCFILTMRNVNVLNMLKARGATNSFILTMRNVNNEM